MTQCAPLTEIFNTNRSDKGTVMAGWEAHGYSPHYEQWFGPMRDRPIRLLEIGVCDPRMPGASLRSWYEYFTEARIFGYDIVDASQFDNDRVSTFIGDQSSVDDMQRFIETHGGGFDIIIDDGSHVDAHQQASLAWFFDYLNPCGQYIIEDMQVSPKTLDLMQAFREGHYRTRSPLLKWLPRGSRHEAPLLGSDVAQCLQAQIESVEVLCDDKLARIVKRHALVASLAPSGPARSHSLPAAHSPLTRVAYTPRESTNTNEY